MRALVFEKHGDPNAVLKVGVVPVPSALPAGFVLVKVHAAAINPIDKIRVEGGLKALRPEQCWPAVVGYDLAGVVERVGEGAGGFAVGDAVVARQQGDPMLCGAVAEYAAVDVTTMAKKPPGISFTDAASLPLAGETALQALRRGGVKEGSRVLITGGAGGVGTLGIQIAKALGAAAVATTASAGEKAEMCASLGADVVVNYRQDKFEEKLRGYDFAFDTTNESHKCWVTLCPPPPSPGRQAPSPSAAAGKQVVTIAGTPTVEAITESMGAPPGFLVKAFLNKKRNTAAEQAAHRVGAKWSYLFLIPSGKDLAEILAWVVEGKVRPVVDNIWSMDEAVAAAQRNFSGRAKGKCVVRVVAE